MNEWTLPTWGHGHGQSSEWHCMLMMWLFITRPLISVDCRGLCDTFGQDADACSIVGILQVVRATNGTQRWILPRRRTDGVLTAWPTVTNNVCRVTRWTVRTWWMVLVTEKHELLVLTAWWSESFCPSDRQGDGLLGLGSIIDSGWTSVSRLLVLDVRDADIRLTWKLKVRIQNGWKRRSWFVFCLALMLIIEPYMN